MRILLGMSGGLDSTYAAKKLIEEGHTVEGAVMKMHRYTEIDEAASSAKSLGIPLHVLDCTEEFERCVVTNFLSEYTLGRTPNPCIICNSDIKFRYLLDYAQKNGFDRIATGHYSRVVKHSYKGTERYTLASPKDARKEQTYVLWRLSQDVLSHLLLPLSDCEKEKVRLDAKNIGLAAADREESQEICFIPSGDYAAFIEERTQPFPHGHFINNEGKILGEHRGIIRYTVGQRKGLGIALGERVFVTEINAKENTVTLSEKDSYRDEIYVSGINFVGVTEPDIGEETELAVKIRYLAPKVKCTFTYLGEGRARVLLSQPQRAVTPGQSAVFYDGDLLALGGFID